MILDIHLEIKPSEICLSELIVLSLLQNKNFKEIKAIHRNTRSNMIEIIEGLAEKGYVRLLDLFIDTEEGDFYPEAVSLRDKALSLLEDKSVDITKLVTDFRALFPVQYKGDLGGCKVKLRAFLNKNRQYSPELILQATKYYNELMTQSNGYRRQAHYFIIKDSVSDLARYCEMVLTGGIPKAVIGDNSIRL